MDVLPWPGRQWEIVPSTEPGATHVKFPCVCNGIQRLGTAIVSDTGQVTFAPTTRVEFEIPPAVWVHLAPALTGLIEALPPASRG